MFVASTTELIGLGPPAINCWDSGLSAGQWAWAQWGLDIALAKIQNPILGHPFLGIRYVIPNLPHD